MLKLLLSQNNQLQAYQKQRNSMDDLLKVELRLNLLVSFKQRILI